MSDIVGRLRSTNYDDLDACKAADIIEQQDKTIQSLYLHVAKLEEEQQALEKGIAYEVNLRLKLESELAALKAGQGEPVDGLDELLSEYWDLAYDEGRHGGSNGSEANAVLHKLRKLYTSATTIPEGFQLINNNRLRDLEEYEWMYKELNK